MIPFNGLSLEVIGVFKKRKSICQPLKPVKMRSSWAARPTSTGGSFNSRNYEELPPSDPQECTVAQG
jgi:hypothetical protein